MSAASPLRTEIVATTRLAVPVMVSRVGILTLVAVDSAMTGHAGAEELAYYALASAVQTPLMMMGIGLVTGTVILVAQAEGANQRDEGGFILTGCTLIAALTSAIIVTILCFGDVLFHWLGQPPDLAVGAAEVMRAIAWGIPGVLLHAAATLFLEGMGRPVPGMVVMLVANVVNVGLNWLLIYGHWGLPALGGEGAALATSAVRIGTALALFAFIAFAINRHEYGLRIRTKITVLKKLLRLGIPVGLSLGLESGAFASMMVFAGWLGAIQTAAFQIGFSLISMPFMAALGLSTAASIRVGNAYGRRDPMSIRRAGWTAVILVVAVESVLCLLYIMLPDLLTTLYTDDPRVIALAIPTVIFAGLVLIPDAVQSVCIGALRGVSEVWIPTGLFLLSFWGAMVPAGYWWGIVAELGASGLMGAVAFGCLVAALALLIRFAFRTRISRPV